MVFQNRPRLMLVALGVVLMTSPLGCGREEPENRLRRNGEDLLASGPAPTVMDSAAGDAILAGANVDFGGAAGGDFLGVGGKQRIGGRIHGSLRAVGGDIQVTAAVDRNATIAGGNVALDFAGRIAGNAYLVGGNVQLDGTVQQSLLVSGGTVILNGVVGRDVEVGAGSLRLGPNARIAGNLRYRVPKDKVHIDSAARVSGTVTGLPVSKSPGFIGVLWLLGFLVAGIVVISLIPQFAAEAAEIVPTSPGLSALVGLGWIILVPIAVVIAAITVIGIPLACVTIAVYVVLLYLGRATIAVWLGRQVLGARARVGRQGVLMNFLIGGLILLIAGAIPFIGPWVTIVATVVGLGTILLRVRSMRGQQQV